MPIAINGSGTLTGLSVGGLENGIITPAELSTGAPSWDAQYNLTNVASINNGPLAGFRNAIINGNFDHWQRGTSFTASEYGADRWIHLRGGTTQTVTRQAFALGQPDVPGEPTYYCRTVVSSVAGASSYAILAQYPEDVRTFAGQQVTVSFWAKVDATKNIAVEIEQHFGTGGSPSTNVHAIGVTKVSIGTAWQKVIVTATVPSLSGKTLGTNGDSSLRVNIWFDAGSSFNTRTDSLGQQSGTFDIAQVQMETGPVNTPFERRPIGTELALCQRYYEVSEFGAFVFNAAQYNSAQFRVTKRASPTVSIFPAAGTVSDVIGGVNGLYATCTNTAFATFTASAEL